jgi:uncharacterized protein (DUF2235 family)
VPEWVQFAFHAVALDETRSKFRPVLWFKNVEGNGVTKCWFLGSHSDVGGNGDAALGKVSLW